MKQIAKLSLAIALLSAVAIFPVQAQGGYGKGHGNGPGHGPGKGYGPDSCHIQLRVNDMAKELGLSEKQEQQILELHYAHIEEVKATDSKYTNDCVGEREARLALRRGLDESVKKILNAEQAKKYEEIMADRRGPHGANRGHWQ